MDKNISNKIADEFYQSIRKDIRRYNPLEFSMAASKLLRLSDTKIRSSYVPHFLLHAIEMNCCYFQEYYQRQLDEGGFNKVINIYHDHLDPYQSHELAKSTEEGLYNFFMSMAVRQFPLQRHFISDIFSRSVLLFDESENLSDFRTAFQQKYSLSIKDWLILCFISFSWLISNTDNPAFASTNFLSSELNLPKESLIPFLNISSIDQHGIIDQHKSREKDFPPFLRIFMKSIFFEFPFLRFSDTYINPHPNLISYLACERIYDLLSKLSGNEFQEQFGLTFEKYIGLLLSDLGDVKVFNEKQIQSKYSLDDEQVCDYLLEFPDCILLIEAKAVQYKKRIINLDYLRESNTSNKIAKGYDQLLRTAEKIKKKKNKLVYGICVTFGQQFLSNVNIYVEKTIIPNMHENIDDKFSPLSFQPQNLSIDEFERLLHAVIFYNETPTHIFQMFDSDRSIQYLDWNTFLNNHFPYKEKNPESILSKKYFDFIRKSGLIK